MVSYCCEDMKENVSIVVSGENQNEGKAIGYSARFNEYGLICRDRKTMLLISYCPWCGKKLPGSLREKWFDELASLGFTSPLFDEKIPKQYMSEKWWEEKSDVGNL